METWNGFEKKEFVFEGRKAMVVLAKPENRTDRWLMKMEYCEAFPAVELAMLRHGWNRAYIENRHRWCDEEDLDLKKRFADHLHQEFGFCKAFVPVGMSCGGMFSVQFAARYPQYVRELYLDAPVLNLLSCPADLGISQSGLWAEYQSATGMTLSKLICSREHPLDRIPLLAEHQIPVVLIYGKEDMVVPYEENGALLEAYYKERKLPILAVGKDGCGHHPHGLEDPKPIVSFLLEHF